MSSATALVTIPPMSLSTRFPSAVHILTLLAIKSDQFVSSECIAKSVGTNAVVVRRLLALLQQAGLVVTQTGFQGGTRLNADPDTLTLLDIYHAVEDQSIFRMHTPHPDCPVACSVKEDVLGLLQAAEEKMREELRQTKLSRITRPALAQYRQMS